VAEKARLRNNGILLHGYDVIVEAFPALKCFKLCFFEKSFGSFFVVFKSTTVTYLKKQLREGFEAQKINNNVDDMTTEK